MKVEQRSRGSLFQLSRATLRHEMLEREHELAAGAELCTSCNAQLSGKYCSNCGERKLDEHSNSLTHFFSHALHDVTHLDSKLWRTLRLLILKPGFLSAEYLAGRRKPYMQPVQLFVVVNVFFFLFTQYSHFTPLTTPLRFQRNAQTYSQAIQPTIDQAVKRSGLSEVTFEEVYNHATHTHARSLIFLMIPAFACTLWLVNARKRRSALTFLTAATHFYSFFLLGITLGVLPIVLLVWLVNPLPSQEDDLISLCLGVIFTIHLAVMNHRLFGGSKWAAAAKGTALTVAVLSITIGYRFVLLFTTLFALG